MEAAARAQSWHSVYKKNWRYGWQHVDSDSAIHIIKKISWARQGLCGPMNKRKNQKEKRFSNYSVEQQSLSLLANIKTGLADWSHVSSTSDGNVQPQGKLGILGENECMLYSDFYQNYLCKLHFF